MDFGPISGLELFDQSLNFFLFFLGILTLIAIFYGGYIMLTAQPTKSNPEKGKKSFSRRLLGF